MDYIDLFLYLLTMSGTPGPNTILSLQNASENGIRKGISLNYGMFMGILFVTCMTYALVSILSSVVVKLSVILQIMSIVYILYLAWKMYGKSSIETDKRESDSSFRRGFMLQLVNVKVLMLALSTISIYVLPYSFTPLRGFLISLSVPLMCFLTGLMWAVAGEALKNVYNAHRKGANTIFALSLLLLALRSLLSLVTTAR